MNKILPVLRLHCMKCKRFLFKTTSVVNPLLVAHCRHCKVANIYSVDEKYVYYKLVDTSKFTEPEGEITEDAIKKIMEGAQSIELTH